MQRVFRFLLVIVILLVSVGIPLQSTSAATYRNWVAQVPSLPNSTQSVRIWMNSDTAYGETAGLEYNIGSSYVKVLGTYDTSYPGANWRADIPAQPNGTTVRYQLFTRNQSGSDYGFTGFNWSYTVNDGDIQWFGLRHDSFDSYYRNPFGAVPAGSSVTLRFRTYPLDVDGVSVRVYAYDPATQSTSGPVDYPMSYLEDRVEGGQNYAIWSYTLSTPGTPAILYYKFRVTDRLDVDYYSDSYVDNHDNLGQGGEGAVFDDEPFPSYQITVYDPAFQTPDWLEDANVYQIFPDRFRNGDETNDYCRDGSTTGCPSFYDGSIPTIAHTTWNEAVYDPRIAGPYFNTYGTQFFGGDLWGIIEKLDYLQSLGIDTLYLTPIFTARSNHRYDTDNYLEIDPALGGDAAFQALIQALQQRGMYLILDGVFNHTSSDSVYFDRYQRYPSEGACESLTSTYRSWFNFYNNDIPCGSGDYEGWFGFDSLAVLTDNSSAVRDFIYRNGAQNVVKYWYEEGASGWRFDVADEISHDWWRDFRAYAKSYNPEGPLVGEVWYDASQFLLGDQLDAVMNYRFRKNVLGFARGSAGWGDNDNNGSNQIIALSPSQFDHALRSVREDYPAEATAAMLNLLDSHDTNRALYVLTLLGDSGLTEAKERLELAAIFQFTYLGAPMVYYGDEAGIDAPSLANGVNGPEDDPYNRAPYPWADESGDTDIYGPADSSLIETYSTLAHLRKQHPALRSGSFETLLTGDTTPASGDNSTFAFARVAGSETAIVAMNNGASVNTASIPVGMHFSDGTQLQDALSGALYTVSGGSLSLSLAARQGAVLFLAPGTADLLAPTASIVLDPAPNGNGWNNTSSVTVNLSASDVGSGVKELRYWLDGGPVVVVSGDSASLAVNTDNTTVNLRAFDRAGNPSSLVSVTVRIDTVAPDTSILSAPPALTSSPDATFTFASTEVNSTFECSLDGSTFSACSSPASYNGLADGSHTFEVRAIDVAGNIDPVPASHAWTVDTQAPETTIDSAPAAMSSSASASFSFSSSEASSTFECSLDGSAFSACDSPASYTTLADGEHIFAVRATDLAGKTDATPATFTWQIDTQAAETIIDSAPAALTSSTSAEFSFHADQAGSTFECSLDGGLFTACSSPVSYTGILDGEHTFAVRATDTFGNVDPTPATHTWTVDTQAPDTLLLSTPALLSSSSSASFTFESNDPAASFECSLDVGSYSPCSSPHSYNGLADGSHTFTVRALDAAGNVDLTPASFTWTVDTTAPDTLILTAPALLVSSTTAAFTFTSNDPAASFECSLDGAVYAGCSSPQSYDSLADGSHTFLVRAIDLTGNTDPTPASHTWTVDTIAPQTTITSAPPATTGSTTASFAFESSETGSSFFCSLDGAAATSCTSPVTYTALAVGGHTFSVYAVDGAGNADATPASHAWTIVMAYQFTGFFQPVDNLPVVNLVKAGSAIPIKFSLGGDFGLNIFATGYPVSQQISCDSGAAVDLIEQTVSAGNSSLSYDPATGQYNYTWKTLKTWSGTCRQLIVRFSDGSEQRANFRFR